MPDDGTVCTEDVCVSGVPTSTPAELGTSCTAESFEVALQTAGDCQVSVCDGAGAVTSVADDEDLPDDYNPCTSDVCTAGVPSNPPVTEGTSCGGALVCNAIGQCTGCTSPTECPGTDDTCKVRTCASQICGFEFTAVGTALPAGDQTEGDCQEAQCNGTGGVQSVADDQDVPAEDGLQCTAEDCANGAPLYPPTPINAGCSQDGGSVCDGAGHCVECNSPPNCTSQGAECEVATCVNNDCGLASTPQGTPAKPSAQTAGDCAVVLCDGSGGTSVEADPGDLPVDNSDCTADVCTDSVPSNPPIAAGTPCAGGGTCDGAGNCSVKKPTGDPCGAPSECTSGSCVDGYCCASACSALCQACAAAKTGSADGTCASIPLGEDPDAECAGAQVCDGSSACTSCGNGLCDAGETEQSCPRDCTSVIDVAGGHDHTCALHGNGSAMCWGANTSGQLGTGTMTGSLVPVPVTGLADGVQLALGEAHSCAVRDGGTVQCWGLNDVGQLGTGSAGGTSAVPVAVTGITTATRVAAGLKTTCALLSGGSVRCWGEGSRGQLGNGTNSASATPVAVLGVTTAVDVAVGDEHACALLASGSIQCWGRNSNGQLGDGTGGAQADTNVPVTVVGISTGTQVKAGGRHSCALLADTTVRCWGRNAQGELGNGDGKDSYTPVAVSGLTGATMLGKRSEDHSCVLLGTGGLRCWGAGGEGQLGNGGTADALTPVAVSGITTGTFVGPGRQFTCAIVSNGSLFCWGANLNGQLGNGTIVHSNVPAAVTGL